MDKCLEHTRQTIGPCMWCGKKLCDKCITYQEGKKYYCDKCHAQLNPQQNRTKLPPVQQIQAKQSFAGHRTGETM